MSKDYEVISDSSVIESDAVVRTYITQRQYTSVTEAAVSKIKDSEDVVLSVGPRFSDGSPSLVNGGWIRLTPDQAAHLAGLLTAAPIETALTAG